MLEGILSSSVWAFYWAIREILMTRIASSKPCVPFSSTSFDLFFHLSGVGLSFSLFINTHHCLYFSPLFCSYLTFHFPRLSFCPPPPVFPHPAHLLRDPALCLPAEAGWKNRQPLCFSDSHHIACMPAPLRSLAVLSLLFCQLTSTNPITTPTLCPPAPPRYICPAIHQ